MLADLRDWPPGRRMVAAAVAVVAFAVVLTVSDVASPLLGPALWTESMPVDAQVAASLSLATVAVGSVLAGLIVASYVGTPIGADATLCDTRWPVLGLVALSLATDLRSAEPLLTGAVRPVVALAAVALLAWALVERLASERRATAPVASDTAPADGEACTTCRPLFTRAAPHDQGDSPTAPATPAASPLPFESRP